jgi:hypothetical protein
MLTKTTALLTTAVFALGAGTALAQSTGGSAADPNSNANRQPAPSATKPTDPAAGSKPSAQQPTSPAGTSSGAAGSTGTSSGEAGTGAAAPAGSPADPNSVENRQPAPSVGKPSDPAAGSQPSAREPTDSSTNP